MVHICSEIRGGGAAQATRNLHESLLAEGIESRILAGDAEPGQERVDRLRPAPSETTGRQVFLRRFLRKNRTRVSSTHFSLDLMGRKVEQEPWIREADIIHLHWVAETLSSASLEALGRLGKRVVWTLHDMRPFTGGCHFSAGCGKFRKSCGQCPQLRTDYFQITTRTLQAMAQAVGVLQPHFVAPSGWMAQQVRSSRIGGGHGVSIIPNGVDPKRFSPGSKEEARRELGLPVHGRMILLAGHSFLEKRKGLDLALQILLNLRNKSRTVLPPGEISLLLAGGDSEEVRPRAWDVHRVGRVPIERMPLLYRAADVLLFPSLEDNLPNVILEAMACGLPVAAHEVGGVVDLLGGPEPCGALFFKNDPQAAAESILRILGEADLAARFSQRSLERVREQFSLSAQAKAMRVLYRSLSIPSPNLSRPVEEGARILINVSPWQKLLETWRGKIRAAGASFPG